SSGTRPESISFAGPGKRRDELRSAISAGIVINVESHRELDTIGELGKKLGTRPMVAIRVNPDFELKASGMRMGGGPKQFGIDAEQVPDELERLPGLGLDFQGFHIFSGSQNLRPEAICEAQSLTVELATRLSEAAPGPVKMLNIGGGFGIPYFPGESYLDLVPIADNLERLKPAIKSAMPEAEVILELGRYLVGEAGIYVCRIIDRKVSRGETFLIADGGLHHHLAASGNFGQVIRKNYPVVIGNHVRESETERASIVGPLCTPLDLLADKMPLGHGDVGDLAVVLQSGAYGYTASPHLFLSQPMPVEICV
ncbi:MAG: pyridoxal-dependent decarboxylase, exosortase A system-associated, partial [Gammaproteobacteria bacterium]|nr:pyridoxal-dependent decarboxylase, exosortase A system-associated [Gammaproteobacteria bacterium]